MRLVISKMTSKYQATVPREVREALRLTARDRIAFEIYEDDGVVIRKALPIDIEYLNALTPTLNEWNSKEDDKAYRNL